MVQFVFNPFTEELDAVIPAGGGGTVGSSSFNIDQSGGTSDTYGVISGLINGSNTTFTTSQDVYVTGTLKVYLNGQLQTQGSSEDWTETSPAAGTFDFITAPFSGDEITATYQKLDSTAGNADTVDGIHASATATANQLIALDANKDLDLGTGDLDATEVNVDASYTAGYTVGGTAGGIYVDRGDPSGWDFALVDLTTDGTFRDLDLSSIVPAGAKAVLLEMVVSDVAGSDIVYRKNGNTNAYNLAGVACQRTGNIYCMSEIVSCDVDRVIEYKATNTTFSGISILVRGWFI